MLNQRLSDFRDPDVFWSAQSLRWIMVVALPNEHKALFYGSPDLKSWQRLSEFGPAGATGGQWECPTLTRVPVEGSLAQSRWVLKVGLNPGALQGGSGEQYFVGSFDGSRFINENPPSTTLWTDYGKDCYCALTFNHLPPDEAPVTLGWMNNWQYAGKVPTSPWRGQMTIPRTLHLTRTSAGLRLSQSPVAAIDRLRGLHFSWQGNDVSELNHALQESAHGRSFELRSVVTPGPAGEFGWKVLAGSGKYTTIGYNNGELFVDRTHSGDTGFSPSFPARTDAALTSASPLDLTILVDRSSVEVFAQSGRVSITNLVYPPAGSQGLQFYADRQPASVRVDVWQMNSIWKPQNQ